MDNSLTNNVLKFEEICGIDELVFVCGLNFPETANEFQKAMLTLAHLSAICRETVMRGFDVPARILEVIETLSYLVNHHKSNQR